MSPHVRREDFYSHVDALDWDLKVPWLTFCSIISSNDYSIRRVSFPGFQRPKIGGFTLFDLTDSRRFGGRRDFRNVHFISTADTSCYEDEEEEEEE